MLLDFLLAFGNFGYISYELLGDLGIAGAGISAAQDDGIGHRAVRLLQHLQGLQDCLGFAAQPQQIQSQRNVAKQAKRIVQLALIHCNDVGKDQIGKLFVVLA